MDFVDWLLARLQEPSSYSGLAGLMTALHLSTDPGLIHNITLACIGLSGVTAFLIAEKTKH